jgi:Tn3 transposase DDE domain
MPYPVPALFNLPEVLQGFKNRLTGRHGAEANGAHQSREETPDAAVLRQQLVEVGIVRRSGQAVDLGHGGFEAGLGHDREDHRPEIAIVDGALEHQGASLAQDERRGVKIAQATQPRFSTFADRVNKHPGDKQVEQVEHLVLRARFQRTNESQQGGAAAFVRQPGDRLGLGSIGEARQRQHTGLRQTEFEPTEIMTDTGAYTDVIFGIFWLLGYQFSPRIADVGGARFWRVDSTADYGALDKLASHKVKTGIVAEHWDDLLRLAGSLKLGLVQVGGLMRTLQTNERPTRLSRALEELGRIIKTLYLLAYIDNEACRRRILNQLNRGEGRHQLARVVFHGKRGELRQRYREGQEDQLGALGLVVNAIILWNTIYMDAALDQLRAEGFDVRDADVARLSPLGHEHINMLGRYAFTLPEPVARGELRPLRSPAALSDDA